MAPEVKIRNLDVETLERLKARAALEARSVESLLRSIVTDAVGDPVTADEWATAGFEEVDEIVPGRLYEAWADRVCYRIAITRPIVRGSSQPWNSSIDQLHVRDPIGNEEDSQCVWVRPMGIPSRLLGDTPELALRDAMRWLGDWAGFDAFGRARRDAEAAERMEPVLRKIADEITEVFDEHAKSTWRDATRASWSINSLDFFISRSGPDEILLMTYLAGTTRHAFAPDRFLLVTDVAKRIVDAMHRHLDGDGKPVPIMRTRPR